MNLSPTSSCVGRCSWRVLDLAILVIEAVITEQTSRRATTGCSMRRSAVLTAMRLAFALEINGNVAMTLVQRRRSKIVRRLPAERPRQTGYDCPVALVQSSGHAVEAISSPICRQYRKSGNEFSKVLFVDPSVRRLCTSAVSSSRLAS